jgi:glycosyltransferase involved in cell wall biosynthesis
MKVSVLIPTYNRVTALAVTLTSLAAQTYPELELIISDQSDVFIGDDQTIQTLIRLLELHNCPVQLVRNLPRRGIAHQRNVLLERATGRYALFLDDDVVLERDAIERMARALADENVGFCGMALIGLSYLDDVRPHQQHIEFWDGHVEPEIIRPGQKEWYRYPLHNAANIYHAGLKLAGPERKYKIAWVGGCVLYDSQKLRDAGGFDFWKDLPAEHCGEDVMAQIRLMEKYGGFGIIPSGAYHLELPTTVTNREVNAPEYLLRS